MPLNITTIPPQFVPYFRDRQWGALPVPVDELLCIEWRFSGRTVYYVNGQIDEYPGFEALQARGLDIQVRLKGASFLTIPRAADISDDVVSFELWDGPLSGDWVTDSRILIGEADAEVLEAINMATDREVTKLYTENRAGVRVAVLRYFPEIDWLREVFWGHLKPIEEGNGHYIKTKAAVGFRSPTLDLPRGAFWVGCPHTFGGELATLADCTENWRCPWDAHLGGSNGHLQYDAEGNLVTTCAKTRSACSGFWGSGNEAIDRDLPHGGFVTRIESHVVTQTRGPNLQAKARGNAHNLSTPPRVVAGHFLIRDLNVLAFTPEPNTNHPDQAALRVVLHISVGPVLSATVTLINGRTPQSNSMGTSQVRLGTFRQLPTTFSSNPQNYSGQAIAYVVDHPGDFRNVTADDISGTEADVYGYIRVRQYGADGSLTLGYSTNPLHWLRTLYEDKDFGLGYNQARFNNASWAFTAAWCDEYVAFRDEAGLAFSGTRATFNADLNKRSAKDTVEDLCRSAFISPPFGVNGELYVTPIEGVPIEDAMPLFADYGNAPTICIDKDGLSSLTWRELEVPTHIKLNFYDEAYGFNDTELLFGSDKAALREGLALGDFTVRPREESYSAFGVTNIYEAERLGNLLLAVGPFAQGGIENPLEITFTTWSLLADALGLHLHQVIKVLSWKLVGNEPPFGEFTTQRKFTHFRITKLEDQADLKLKVVAVAHPIDFWERIQRVDAPPPLEAGRAQLPPTYGDTQSIINDDYTGELVA